MNEKQIKSINEIKNWEGMFDYYYLKSFKT